MICEKLLVLEVFFLTICLGYISTQNVTEIINHSPVHLEKEENPAVTNFREYLRIKTAQPTPDYDNAIQWLRKQAMDIGIEFTHIQFKAPDLFAVWMTWRGSDPSLKSILLNGHMDVVGANPANWVHDPFEAFKDADGNIYARGAQDMKSTTVAQLEAIRKLKNEGFVPLRTVHLSVLPDEEVGGLHGMLPFVKSKNFKKLNIGFDLDEGSGSTTDVLVVGYGQKAAWQVNFTATGVPGHGGSLPNGTAGEKIQIVIDRMMKFRQQQKDIMLSNPDFGIEDVTTVNLVQLGGGIAVNVLPDKLWAIFDIRIRIRPNLNFTTMDKLLSDIRDEAGPGVSYEFIQKNLESAETPMDASNIWWMTLKATFDQMNWKYIPKYLFATSDARYVRSPAIPTFSFNPTVWVPFKAHQDNEFLNENTFLDGIERYAIVLRNLTQVHAMHHE